MTCPHCGAPMRLDAGKDYLVCDFCGSVHVPNPGADGVRVLGGSSAAQCPRCVAPLVDAAVGGQRILYCERCRGVLVPMGTFATLVQDLRSHRDMTAATVLPFEINDLNRRTDCPNCGQPMDTHLYGGGGNVVIGDCEHCEVNWLEYGQLERIVRAPDWQYHPDV